MVLVFIFRSYAVSDEKRWGGVLGGYLCLLRTQAMQGTWLRSYLVTHKYSQLMSFFMLVFVCFFFFTCMLYKPDNR